MARSSTDRPIPLAVLNLFEHAYIGEKYGVWSRGEYARDWFKALNWNTVQKRSAHTG
jgi:Fe-Mn family superoxide dismutase